MKVTTPPIDKDTADTMSYLATMKACQEFIRELKAENAELKKDNADLLHDVNKSEQCCGELLEEVDWLRERVPSDCYGDDHYADHFIKGIDG